MKKKQTQWRLSNVKWMSWPWWWKNYQSPCMRDSPPIGPPKDKHDAQAMTELGPTDLGPDRVRPRLS